MGERGNAGLGELELCAALEVREMGLRFYFKEAVRSIDGGCKMVCGCQTVGMGMLLHDTWVLFALCCGCLCEMFSY